MKRTFLIKMPYDLQQIEKGEEFIEGVTEQDILGRHTEGIVFLNH